MLLSIKSKNLTLDSMSGLETLKRVLVFLSVVFAFVYSYISLAFGIKFILTAVLAYLFAREVEMLFLTHQRKMNRQQAKEHIYYTKPEVSGLILAMLLPVHTPIYITIIGIAFGVFIAKMAFGGYSFNIFNIAIASRVFIQVSWPDIISNAKATGLSDYLLALIFKPDYSSINTLLTDNVNFSYFIAGQVNFLALIISAAILLGFIYLCINSIAKVSNLFLPVLFFIILFLILGLKPSFILSFISSPLVLLVLVFGLNDPFTNADSSAGRFVSQAIFVSVASFMMVSKNNSFAIIYALLFMNMLVPLIDAKLVLKTRFIKPIIISAVLIIGSAFVLKPDIPEVQAGASITNPDANNKETDVIVVLQYQKKKLSLMRKVERVNRRKNQSLKQKKKCLMLMRVLQKR